MKSRKRRYAEIALCWAIILGVVIVLWPVGAGIFGVVIVGVVNTYRYLNEVAYQEYYKRQERAKRIYRKKFGHWSWWAENGCMIPFVAATIALIIWRNEITMILWAASFVVILVWCIAMRQVLDKKPAEE